MIIKSSKEYHYLVVFSLFSVVLFFFVMCSVSDSIKFPVVSVIPLLILVIRAWISSCRTYIIDEGGITVRFLWYQRTFKWDELKTKRIENYSNSIGYRQPYTRGVIFYNKATKKPAWLMPAEYSMLIHPFCFIFIYFDPHISFGKWDIRCPDLYVVEETEFRENIKKWGIDLEERDG